MGIRIPTMNNSWIRISLRTCCPKPREVGRAVPSAPRRFRLHSICAAFVNSIGALGTARPTFWLFFHLGNRPSGFALARFLQSLELNALFLKGYLWTMAERLPIYEIEQEMLAGVRAHRRLIVSAPTGSGKST